MSRPHPFVLILNPFISLSLSPHNYIPTSKYFECRAYPGTGTHRIVGLFHPFPCVIHLQYSRSIRFDSISASIRTTTILIKRFREHRTTNLLINRYVVNDQLGNCVFFSVFFLIRNEMKIQLPPIG